MKHLTNISSVALLSVFLLVAGAGACLSHCACKNTTTVLLPLDVSNCCNDAADCMSIESVSLSPAVQGVVLIFHAAIAPVLGLITPALTAPALLPTLPQHGALCATTGWAPPGSVLPYIQVFRL